MITLVVTYRFAADGGDEAIEHLSVLQEASRAEPGCLRFDVARQIDSPASFLLVEQYTDEDALECHGTSEHFRKIVEQTLMSLLEERSRECFSNDV